MNGFRADPDRLAAHAREFSDLADRAGSIMADLTGALDEAGRCWGTDEIGQSFEAAHVGAANDTLDALGSLGGQLADVGARFTEMAETYRRADEGGARGVDAAGV